MNLQDAELGVLLHPIHELLKLSALQTHKHVTHSYPPDLAFPWSLCMFKCVSVVSNQGGHSWGAHTSMCQQKPLDDKTMDPIPHENVR